jgi:hypothetical protein
MKLIINRFANPDAQEVFVDGNMSPKAMRDFVFVLCRNSCHKLDAICTFSPAAIQAFVDAHKAKDEPLDYNNIFVHKDGVDVCVVTLRDPVWLVHFSLAELYMDGEI